jgi:FkbM family methyltransferase
MLKKRATRKLTHIWARLRPSYHQNGVTIPADEGNIPLYFWEPTWKAALVSRFLASSPGVFIDVGANVGQTLLDYCASPAKSGYLGFEPNPACAARLGEIIKSSALADCAVVPAALSAATGIIQLHLSSDAPTDTCATHVGESRPEAGLEAINIAAYRFDDISDALLRGRRISLVKIDVERGELDVLRGMERLMLERRTPIMCEVLHHHNPDTRETSLNHHRQLAELILSRQYCIFRIDKTQHEGDLAGFTRMEAFPDEVYGHGNQHLCDYLLLPEEAGPPR